MFDIKKHRLSEKIVLTIIAISVILLLLHALLFSSSFTQSFQYSSYLFDGIGALTVIFGAYLVYRFIIAAIHTSTSAADPEAADLLKLIVRILFYIVIIAIILDVLGINIQGILAGSAVGGIIIGLAVQTVLSNILSGFLVSSSKTLKPGDPVIIKTSSLGELVGEVTRVKTIWTEVKNLNGNTVRVPNSILVGTAIFTKIKSEGVLNYGLRVTVNSDVPTKKLMDRTRANLNNAFSKRKGEVPKIYLASKDGPTNTFSVIIKTDRFSEINSLVNAVNSAFDLSYWELKK